MRASERVKKILSSHETAPLDTAVKRYLEELMGNEARKAGIEELPWFAIAGFGAHRRLKRSRDKRPKTC